MYTCNSHLTVDTHAATFVSPMSIHALGQAVDFSVEHTLCGVPVALTRLAHVGLGARARKEGQLIEQRAAVVTVRPARVMDAFALGMLE